MMTPRSLALAAPRGSPAYGPAKPDPWRTLAEQLRSAWVMLGANDK